MNCKGCIHCHLVRKSDAEYIDRPFHYCDIHIEYDSIGQASKWCEGRDYEEKKEQETAEANPLYQR